MACTDRGGLAPDDPAFDISDAADVEALLRAEDHHFWHRARNHFILKKLRSLGAAPGARLLELGCGAGCVAAELSRAGYDITGVEGHRALLEVARRRAPRANFLCRDLRSGVPDLEREAFDVVALFDVIEHLDEPRKALASALRPLRKGGLLVGTVPALMALWSPIDEHAGHKIRYSERTLREVLSGLDGATVVEISSFFRSLVPMMWAQRRMIGRRGDAKASVQNLSVPPWPLNAALFALVSLEHALAPLLDRRAIAGASLWFALKRQ